MTAPILASVEGMVGRIVLNRPDKLNAFTAEMLDLLEAACDELEANPEVRVVIVSSATERAFSAGADISVGGSLGPLGKWAHWARKGHRTLDRLAQMRVPSIAAIGGVAYGGGLELALACDMRIAAASARLALPEVTIGTTPAWGGTARLPALIGAARAKQMILSGQPVDAQKALAWGLVNEVVPAAQLQSRAFELATHIAGNAPIAVQAAKQLIDAGLGNAQSVAIESLASGFAAGTDDMKEGAAAFTQKRRPKYTGK